MTPLVYERRIKEGWRRENAAWGAWVIATPSQALQDVLVWTDRTKITIHLLGGRKVQWRVKRG